MTDIIDSFIVSLGLDPTNYNREIKNYRDDRKRLGEEEKRANQTTEDSQKRLTAGFRTLRNEAAGFLLVLAGANSVKQFVGNILTGDAAVGRLAKNLGVATESLSAWQGAVQRVGGSSGDIDSAFRGLSGAFQSLQLTGTTGNDADFQGLGVGAKDLRNPEEALLKISDASSRMGRSEFSARLGRLGFNESTITLLARGRGEVTRMLEEQRRLGVTTDKNAEASAKFDEQLVKLESAIKGKLRPTIEDLVGGFVEWIEKGDNVNTLMDISAGLIVGIGVAAAGALGPLGVLAAGVAFLTLKFVDLNKAGSAWQILGLRADKFYAETMAEANRKSNPRLAGQYLQRASDDADSILRLAESANARPSSGGREGFPSPWSGGIGGRGPARVPRGQRAVALDGNNPGGLNDGAFARSQPGYVGNNGRYAAFATMEAGVAAQRALLASYVRRGYNTPQKIAHRWAPEGDGNNSNAYAATIARQMGIGVNDQITPAQLNAFQHAQAITENGRYSRMVRPGANVRPGGSAGGSVNQTTTVGQVIVYSAATDAEGVARDMRGALAKRGLVAQANTGLTG